MRQQKAAARRSGPRRGLFEVVARPAVAALAATVVLLSGLTAPAATAAAATPAPVQITAPVVTATDAGDEGTKDDAPPSVLRAGPGVLNVSITAVDDAGAPITSAQRGVNSNRVSYRVDYACAVADCADTTVTISPSQPNPWGITLTGAAAPGLLRYQNWTPPAAGFAAAPSGTDTTGKVFSLGTIGAGSSGSFTAAYVFVDPQRSPSGASFYPSGFQIVHSATISSPTATADATATAAPVTWNITVPSPTVALSNPGVVKPGVDIAYKVFMTDGAVYWSGGNFLGSSGAQGAGNTTVTMQVPAQAEVVNPGTGTYDAVARTITWSEGTIDDPTQCAAGGWGLAYENSGSWNTQGPCYTPRSVVLRYTATAFADADANGCNFSTNVTPRLTVSATYLDQNRTTKTATGSATHAVSCFDPFGRLNAAKDVSNGTAAGSGIKNVAVPPATTGVICPASGFDDWGRTCAAGEAVTPFAAVVRNWAVNGRNAGNVPGVITIADDQLDQPGMPVDRIAVTATTPAPVIDYTYRCGTATPVSGTATGTNLLLTAVGGTAADCRFTAATVTSGAVAPGNIRPSDGGAGTAFQVNYYFTLQPGTAFGQRPNAADVSISYPDYPELATREETPAMTANLVDWPRTTVRPGIAASFTGNPVVTGGGLALPGTEVTYRVGGTTNNFAGVNDFEPQVVFLAPVGWTVTEDSASFPDTVPAGVAFDYRTVTLAGVERSAVVASWPAGTVHGMNVALAPMTVSATPTFAVAPGTNSIASAWYGDARNTVWTSTTATFTSGAQDTTDLDGDGVTTEWFSRANSTAVQVGAASGTGIQKQICRPDDTQIDGCSWIGDPGQSVEVSTVASAIKYRIRVTNSGNTSLTGVVAYDVLPYVGDTGTSDATAATPRGSTFDETLVAVDATSAGVVTAYSSSTSPPRPEVFSGATTGGWTAASNGARALRITYPGTLAPGQSVFVEYSAAVGAGADADARACNSVALDTTQTLPSEPPAVCAVTAEADLAVTAPASVQGQIGRPAVLPFSVTNLGGSATASGSVAITVPAGITVTGLAPAGWTCTAASSVPVVGPAVLECSPEEALQRGVPVDLDLPVIVTRTDVTIGGSATGPAYDPDEDNNDGAILVEADAAAPGAGLAVSKDDGVASAVVGDELTYTVSVRNELTTEAVADVAVTDTIPAGTAFVSASDGGVFDAGVARWTLAALAADTTATRTVTVRVLDAAATTITNEASATAADPAFPDRTLSGSGTDSDTVERLELIKSGALPDPASPAPGDEVTYTFVLTNRGGGPLAGVAITDAMEGLSDIAIGSWPSLPNRLGAGESVTGTATYTLTAADLDAGTVSNTATAEATTVDGATVEASATEDIALPPHGALALDKTASVASTGAPRVGDVVTYTFVVRNTGTVTVRALAIDDPLDGLSPLEFEDWPSIDGVLGAGQEIRATATYTLTAADLDRGRLDNTATVTGTASGGAGVDATDDVRLDLPATAALQLEKTGVQDEPGRMTAGDTVRYTFVVTNVGNVTLTGVEIQDELPGLSEIDYGTWPGAEGVLAAGASITATATYATTQTDVDRAHVDNTATVRGTSPGGEPASATDAASVAIPADPSISLDKTASLDSAGAPRAGDVVTYSFVVTNTGSLTVSGVAISDPMEDLSAIVFGEWPDETEGVLAPGDEVRASASYELTQADIDRGRVDNIATASGIAAGGAPLTAEDGATVPFTAAPSIALTKRVSAPDGVLRDGDGIDYTFEIENTGTVTLSGVALTDALPGLSDVAFDEWPQSDGVLAPGQRVTASATYALTQSDLDAGSVANTATATGTGARGGEVADDDEALLELDAAPGIALTKAADPVEPDAPAAGDAIDYSFVIENTGNVTVNAVTLGDELPGLSTIEFGDWPDAERSLAPGEHVTARASYVLTQADLDAGSVFNRADVSALPVRGDAVDAVDDVTVELPALPALAFRKTAALEDEERPVSGHLASFTFTVENTGNVTVDGVAIADEFEGLSDIVFDEWPADSGVLAPGQSITATATSVLTQADVDAGSIENTATVSGTPVRGDDLSEEASVALPITAAPALAIVKSAAVDDVDRDGSANPGESILYSFEVTNTGTVTLTDVVVDDPKVRGVDGIPTLAPGESATVVADPYTVTEAEARAGVVVNTATASGAAPSGIRVTSQESSTATAAAMPPVPVEVPTEGGGLATTGGASLILWGVAAVIALLLGAVLMLRQRIRRRLT